MANAEMDIDVLDVLDVLASDIERETAEATDAYRELVTAVADGKRLSPDAVKRVLDRAEKSISELRSDVGVMNRRRGLLAKMAEAEAAVNERPGIAQQLAAADAALNAAEVAHEQAVGPLYARRREIDVLQVDGAAARKSLIESCPYVSVNSRLQLIESQRQAIGRAKGELARELSKWEKILASGEADAFQRDNLPGMIERKREQIKPYDEELRRLDDAKQEVNELALKP